MISDDRYRRLCALAARRVAEGPEALCGEAPDDVREVERLLAESSSELDAPLVDPALLRVLADSVGDEVRRRALDRAREPSVAGYRIERLLGHGAHADVWEATELSPLKRRVALKVLACRASEVRFDLERRILARLVHPNLARVFGAGETDDGRPFLALELLVGRPFVEACLEPPRPLRERIALLVEACRAVQFAHDRGVLHRDLKPSNVLVVEDSGRAIAKVIDFGIAKSLESGDAIERSAARMTRTGHVVGTPAYMSPEQLGLDREGKGDIDVRTDVYGLGSLLFEALVGRARWDLEGLSLAQAIRTIDTLPPLAAEAIAPDLDRDLLAILERALARDPRHRFPSAAALADDLERWLAGAPIESRRAPWLRRVAWSVRRHRMRAGLAVGGAIALLGIVIGGVLHYAATARENERLRAWSAATVRALVGLADVPGSDEARDRLSTLLVEELGARELGDDPELLGLWSDAASRRSDLLRERGDAAQAEAMREQALEAAARAVALRPEDPIARRRMARCLVLLGDIAKETGRHARCLEFHERAHAIFVELADAHPGEREFGMPLVWSFDRLVDGLVASRRLDEALAMAERMLEHATALDADRRDPSSLQALIAARGRVLLVGICRQDPVDRLGTHLRNLEDCRTLVAMAPHNRTYEMLLAQVAFDAANGARLNGQRDEAERLLGECVVALQGLVAREDAYLDAWCRLAQSLSFRAQLLQEAGRIAEAEAVARESLAIATRTLDAQPDHPTYSETLATVRSLLASIEGAEAR